MSVAVGSELKLTVMGGPHQREQTSEELDSLFLARHLSLHPTAGHNLRVRSREHTGAHEPTSARTHTLRAVHRMHTQPEEDVTFC